MTARIRGRRERKYLLDAATFDVLAARLSGMLRPDPNAPPEGYVNHSVYFDSIGHRAYLDKREGMSLRTKPRLRTYRDEPFGAPNAHFLEFKSRRDETILKERVRVDGALARRLLDVGSGPLPPPEAGEHMLVRRFDFLSRRWNLVPAATVMYRRRAFQSPWSAGLRVTFDTQVVATFPGATRGVMPLPILPPNRPLIEIKYDWGFPAWLQSLIQELELERVSISKYGLAIERLHRFGAREAAANPMGA